MLFDIWHLFMKYLRISMRMPMWTLFGLIQPLLWLIIFSALFSRFANTPGFPAGSYIEYFLPGVIVMTVLFGSSWSGVSLLREITAGTVARLLVSPVSRTAIVLSRVLHSAFLVLLQVIIVMIAALLMGAHVSINGGLLFAGLIAVVILGVAFASVSNGLAILLQREEPLVIIGNLMTLPLMFFSSAMVPQALMPEWLQYIAMVNPVEYGVQAARAAINTAADGNTFWSAAGITTLFALVTTAWAVNSFKALRD